MPPLAAPNVEDGDSSAWRAHPLVPVTITAGRVQGSNTCSFSSQQSPAPGLWVWRLEYSVITNEGSMGDPHMERGLESEI